MHPNGLNYRTNDIQRDYNKEAMTSIEIKIKFWNVKRNWRLRREREKGVKTYDIKNAFMLISTRIAKGETTLPTYLGRYTNQQTFLSAL